MAPKDAAFKKALDFIKAGIHEQKGREGERLPTTASLAAKAGVSRGTMLKAVGNLRKSGLLSVKERSRIFAGSKGEHSPSRLPTDPSHSWEAKRMLLEQDLLSGAFSPGRALPSVNELQSRYGVSYRIMRKVLNAAAADRIIIPDKKKFYMPRLGKRGPNLSICWVREVGLSHEVRTMPHREEQIVESLERECSQAGIKLLFLNFNIDLPDTLAKAIEWLTEHGSIDGYIIRPLSYERGSAIAELFNELIVRIALDKKPIAILDELGLFSLPPALAPSRLIKIFRIADFHAGQCVGRALLSLGHKRIAYITHHQNEAWSQRRFEGIRAEYAKAGFNDSVSYFSTRRDLIDLINSALTTPGKRSRHVVSDLIRSLECLGFPPDQIAIIEPFFRTNEELISELCKSRLALEKTPKKGLNPYFRKTIIARGEEAILTIILHFLMRFLFEKVSAETTATAWVGANDEAAIGILAQLQQAGGESREISVAGFDNSPLAFEMGITSYDFNLPNIVRQMLLFIGHPLDTTRFTKRTYIEPPGLLITRDSTRRAKSTS